MQNDLCHFVTKSNRKYNYFVRLAQNHLPAAFLN